MSSPFPGMNPYLESPSIWEDFHANLAGEIQAQLNPTLRPKYVAALIPRVTYEEILVEAKPQTIKPDVSVIQHSDEPFAGDVAAIAAPPITARVPQEVPVKLYTVEVRETADGTLVTAIEILSPVNKRRGHEAFTAYRRKRRDLARSQVNLLEIDLLRQGERFPLLDELPDDPYFIFLQRIGIPRVSVWPVTIGEPIPVVPVPLLEPDPDVPLDLGQAIHNIYDRAAYDLRIDYSQPPPGPDLPPALQAQVDEHLQAAGIR